MFQIYTDVVELDPGVVSVAEKWFGFCPDSRLQVHVGDGLEHIKNMAKTSRCLYLDVTCFNFKMFSHLFCQVEDIICVMIYLNLQKILDNAVEKSRKIAKI